MRHPAPPAPGLLLIRLSEEMATCAQTLGDLSVCLAGLGRGAFPVPATADWADPALGALRLDDLRLRLAGQVLRQDPVRHAVDFF